MSGGFMIKNVCNSNEFVIVHEITLQGIGFELQDAVAQNILGIFDLAFVFPQANHKSRYQ